MFRDGVLSVPSLSIHPCLSFYAILAPCSSPGLNLRFARPRVKVQREPTLYVPKFGVNLQDVTKTGFLLHSVKSTFTETLRFEFGILWLLSVLPGDLYTREPPLPSAAL